LVLNSFEVGSWKSPHANQQKWSTAETDAVKDSLAATGEFKHKTTTHKSLAADLQKRFPLVARGLKAVKAKLNQVRKHKTNGVYDYPEWITRDDGGRTDARRDPKYRHHQLQERAKSAGKKLVAGDEDAANSSEDIGQDSDSDDDLTGSASKTPATGSKSSSYTQPQLSFTGAGGGAK